MVFSVLSNLFQSRSADPAAQHLYVSAVQAARTPALFTDFGVVDTVDGRFDLLALHVFLIQNRLLNVNQKAAKDLSQQLSNFMWTDMDDAIREIGVGDLSVPKHLKRMIGAYQGRVRAYAETVKGTQDEFAMTLWRNVYREAEGTQENAYKLAQYIQFQYTVLKDLDESALMKGHLTFPTPDQCRLQDAE